MTILKSIFITFILLINILHAEALSIKKGWQLMGTSQKIENMEVFRFDCTLEVIAYRDNKWLKYAPSDTTLTHIDAQEGFWVLGERECTIQTNIVVPPMVTKPKQETPVQPVPQPDTTITQDVSHIDENTTIFSSDVRLTYEEAIEYCKEYDAYLPTKDEQMAHYLFTLQRGLIYSSGRHWSSSEHQEDSSKAYEVILYFALPTPKDTKLFARCIQN